MPGSALIGNLAINLALETAAFLRGANITEKRVAAMGDNMAKLGKKLSGLGTSMATFITAPLAGLAAVGIKEAQETATAMAQVRAGLASMGPVAGRTAEQLQGFANSLEGKSLFEADEILKKVTANMLTFGSISGENFDKAQQAAVDLATRMGTDLTSATIMVGKALNDPIKGLTAMRRVGIQFTQQQQDQIKAMVAVGDTAGAQALMLKELNREFGGSAAAAQNADPWNRLSDAFKNIAESIGTLLLPLIPPLASALEGVANWVSSLSPTTQTWVVGLGATAAAIGPLLIVLGTMVSSVGSLLAVLVKIGPILGVVRAAMLALLANPFVLGAAALIAGIYLAWRNWDKITAIVQRVYTGVKTWIVDKLNAVWKWVTDKIHSVTNAFANMYDAVVGHSYVPDMVDGISQHFGRLQAEMVKPAQEAAAQVMQAFGDIAGKAIDDFGTAIADAALGTKSLADSFADMAKSIIHDLIEMTTRFLVFRAIAGIFGQSSTTSITPLKGGVMSITDTPGFANGGSGVFGGFAGVDQNVLSLNGSPIARVSKGEAFSVGNDNGPGSFVVNQYNNFAGGAVTRDDLARMHSVTVAAAKSAVAEERRRAG